MSGVIVIVWLVIGFAVFLSRLEKAETFGMMIIMLSFCLLVGPILPLAWILRRYT